MSDTLIDTHTHLDDTAFAEDIDRVIAASREAGVTEWINVGYSPTSWESTRRLAERVDGMHVMLGMHPGSVDEWSDESASQLARIVDVARPVAIGEIGLDLHWRHDNIAVQLAAFERQLQLAESLDLPAVIHMRSADSEMANVLRTAPSLPHIHFHSFDGGLDLRRHVLELGSTIGVGGLMTRRDSESLRSWIADVPRDRVVLETDAPYLKPQGIRGRRNEPAFMTRVADRLAELWSTPRTEVDRITTANARRIFNLKTNG